MGPTVGFFVGAPVGALLGSNVEIKLGLTDIPLVGIRVGILAGAKDGVTLGMTGFVL